MNAADAVYTLRSKVAPVEFGFSPEAMTIVRAAMRSSKVGSANALCRFAAHRGACVGELLARDIGVRLLMWTKDMQPGVTCLEFPDGTRTPVTCSMLKVIVAFSAFNARFAPYEVW